MVFPIILEHNRLLNQIHHLDEREKETRHTMDCIQAERNHIVEMIRLGMATSGTKVLDFALVACGGVHDMEVEHQYKEFEANLAFAASNACKVPKTILVVQAAYHASGNGSVEHLRCIHLASLVFRRIEYNPYSQLIDIPVAGSVYVRSEIFHTTTGAVTTHDGLRESAWLTVGPLRNKKYCHAMRARNGTTHQNYVVPYEAGFTYTLYPCDRHILSTMEVDVDLVTECMRRWTHLRALHAR
jgi:hypothetical protein